MPTQNLTFCVVSQNGHPLISSIYSCFINSRSKCLVDSPCVFGAQDILNHFIQNPKLSLKPYDIILIKFNFGESSIHNPYKIIMDIDKRNSCVKEHMHRKGLTRKLIYTRMLCQKVWFPMDRSTLASQSASNHQPTHKL